MAGSARQSVPENTMARVAAVVAALTVLAGAAAVAQELYKYRGENGEWIYSDRPPEDGQVVEIRKLKRQDSDTSVEVTHSFVGTRVEMIARNDYYAPVELRLEIASIRGLTFPQPEQEMTWILQPRSTTNLFDLQVLEDGASPYLEYGFRYLPGDTNARHEPLQPYRVPFAISNNYPVTQAYPEVITHTSPDSYYAVDMAMPVGTDIFSAREGIVFDVASTNFRAGLDVEKDGPAANVVRILHDDGTYAIYAHLNTNTIRVKPGDRVGRGEYIADSGNTGFSSGPHLHFAVVRNVGMRIESVPLTFQGANHGSVVPASGMTLTAY